MNRLEAERTLSPESPLLDGRGVADPFTQEHHTSLATGQPGKALSIRRRRSIKSIIFNLTILTALVYGSKLCINTIQDTLQPKNQWCLNSVSTSYNYLTFTGAGYGSWAGPKCQNHKRIISTYASGKVFCSDPEIVAGFERIREDCRHNEMEFPDWRKVVENVSDEDIRGMRVVEFGEIPSMENVTEPVILSRAFFDRVDATLVSCLWI